MAWNKLLTEFIGTLFLVLVIGLSGDPYAIGLILMVMVYMGGHVSGAHYNPAVTIGLLLRKKISVQEAIQYIITQLAAGIAAACLVFVFTGNGFLPTPGADMGSAFWIEVLFTFALVLVIMNVAATKATSGNSYFGAAIGLTVLAAALAGGPISGGAFNPAVGLGPWIWNLMSGAGSTAGHVWFLYLLGPILGAVLAAAAHSVMIGDEK